MTPPSLDGYRATRITTGESGGIVKRLDAAGRPSLYLKRGTGRIAQDIADEAARLMWLCGRMSVPAIVDTAREADKAWLLTTAMPGETIDALLDAGAVDITALLPSLAALLRSLHALPVDECPFDAGAPVRLAAAHANLVAGRVDTDDFDPARRGWSAERVWAHLQRLRPATFDRVVTHGDFSFGNILVEDGRVAGMIDVGRAGVADPYQDLAILWLNLEKVGAGLGDRLLAAYGVTEPDRARLDFHLCLDEFF